MGERSANSSSPAAPAASIFPPLLTCLFAVAVAFAAAFFMPSPALAKSYSGDCEITEVDIQASVQEDGSLVVVEQRAIEVDGAVRLCWDFEEMLGELSTFEEEAADEDMGSLAESQVEGPDVSIEGVQLAVAAEGDAAGEGDAAEGDADAVAAADAAADWAALGETSFVESWRDDAKDGPAASAYAYDETNEALYLFLNEDSGELIVQISYRIDDAVAAYEDVGELYWRYLDSAWELDAADVTAVIELPVPEGTADATEGVYAWGHGSSDGTVGFAEDGRVVYESDEVPAGQYAEAHVLFPVEWLSGISAAAAAETDDEARLDEAVAEEDGWTDEDSQSALFSLVFIVAIGLACVALLVWALWAYLRYGREYTPDFTDKYLREPPDGATHPAVLGRLWRWDHQYWGDFSATFLRVIQTGYVRAELLRAPAGEGAEGDAASADAVADGAGADADRADADADGAADGAAESVAGAGAAAGDAAAAGAAAPADPAPQLDCRLTLAADPDEVPDPLDAAMLRLLFEGELAQDGVISLTAIEAYAGEHPEELNDAVQSWQDGLSARVAERDFFETGGQRLQRILLVAALLLAVVGVAASVMSNNPVALAFVLPTAAALLVIANYLPRRSREGNELIARCKALRNWLRDLPEPAEELPQDASSWAELLVYAVEFGVGDKLLGRLRTQMPQLFGAPDAGDADAAEGDFAAEEVASWPKRHVAWLDMDGETLLLALELLQSAAREQD